MFDKFKSYLKNNKGLNLPPEVIANTENAGQENLGEETLGNKETSNQTPNIEAKEENDDDNSSTAKNEEIKDETFETAKDSTGGKFDTLTIVQEVAKIEAKIENAKGNSLNVNDFYKNLNNYLTDDEKQLRFEDDQTKYIEAVNTAKEKWTKENSVDTSKDEEVLEKAKAALVISQAIDTILKDPNYKDFNFVKLQDFYHNDLTKKEQAALDKGSDKTNLPDYFKKVHDEYKKRNPKNVKNVQAPGIPDVSNASRTAVEDANEIKKEQDNKKHMEKIGFRKL